MRFKESLDGGGVRITANNRILGHLTANSNKSTVTVKILKNE